MDNIAAAGVQVWLGAVAWIILLLLVFRFGLVQWHG